MTGAFLAPSLVPLVAALAECFTVPSFVTFRHLLAGWILCPERHTVTGILRASGAVGAKHHTSFHRFFRQARWDLDAVGLCLLKLVIRLIPGDEPIIVPLDDTLGRHTGKHIRGASMHHDPLLSTRAKPVFHWGHVWVVLSIVVRVPGWKKTFALPVLTRLYRSEKLCKKERRPFRKKTELAADMVAVLAAALPERRFPCRRPMPPLRMLRSSRSCRATLTSSDEPVRTLRCMRCRAPKRWGGRASRATAFLRRPNAPALLAVGAASRSTCMAGASA